ncbi:phosphoribosylanthranilate isomerase [Methanothermobacter thermautotrophicus]|uniref:phosphoribosylanthranilate isomerase n=1 Tax=Methanothermobacter thermautotrophicus TaxID=145262 RepID=UPI003D7F80F3
MNSLNSSHESLADVLVKICGIKRPEDAILADELGADLLGLIHIERSPRNLTLEGMEDILSLIPPEKAVIVLEPSDPVEVAQVIERTGVERIQLHSLSGEDARGIKRVLTENGFNARITVAVPPEPGALDVLDHISCSCVLLDSSSGGRTGGTGRMIPPELALRMLRLIKAHDSTMEVALAGGLGPSTVRLNPEYLLEFDCLDFNSGIEVAPGIKDHAMMFELMECMERMGGLQKPSRLHRGELS